MSATPTSEEMIARARAFKTVLRERAGECERLRRCPDATVADYLDQGFHRILQPKRYGGYELGWDVMITCVSEWAEGDASQAWAMMVHSNYAHMVGSCTPELQEEVWGKDQNTLLSSAFQPTFDVTPADGGYIVSGRWSFASGIDEAQWVAPAGIIPGKGHSFFFVPIDQATVIDDWYVAGLAGTGSKTFTLDKVFVPVHRTIVEADLNNLQGPGLAVNTAPVYRAPFKAGAAFCFSAATVGCAAGMLEAYKEIARGRSTGGKSPRDATLALRLSECSIEIDAAKWSTQGAGAEIMRTVESGVPLTKEKRIDLRRMHGYSNMLAHRVSGRIYAASGIEAIYKSSPLQRGFRDIAAASNHMALAWEFSGMPYGQQVLGQEPTPGNY